MNIEIKSYKDMSEVDSTCLFFMMKLDEEFFPSKWTKEGWESAKNADHYLNYIIQDSEIVGFSLFFTSHADFFAHLYKIVIKKNLEGQKLGSKLFEAALLDLKKAGIKEFYLEVEEENVSAQALYKKFNFKIAHRKKNFYSNGNNALIMTLSI